MTPEEFYSGPAADLLAAADAIMRPKMADYTGGADFAANFKRTALRTGTTPAVVWAVFADKHWGCICNALKSGRAESEDMKSRLADVINYCLLLWGMLEDGTVEVAK